MLEEEGGKKTVGRGRWRKNRAGHPIVFVSSISDSPYIEALIRYPIVR
jgi:hypothetical protein